MHHTTGGIQQSEMEYLNIINSVIESIHRLYQHAYSREIMNVKRAPLFGELYFICLSDAISL